MLGIPAVTLGLVGLAGGIGATGTFITFHVARMVGEELKPEDLLPLPPPNLPVPRFFYTKPELVAKLKNGT